MTLKSVTLSVRIIPNSQHNAFVAWMQDGRLKIKITAPAVDNKANQALKNFLADTLKTNARAIIITTGKKNRNKQLTLNLTPESYQLWIDFITTIPKDKPWEQQDLL